MLLVCGMALLVSATHAQVADESLVLTHEVRARLGVSQVQLPDGEVRYELKEAESRDMVVLVHGYSVPSFVWGPVSRELNKAGLSTLTYDLYGHGLSDRPAPPYTRALYVRQLKGLLDQVAPDRPLHLVGWSMGAMIAAMYATEHPRRVLSMTMVSPSGLPIRMGLMGRAAMVPLLGDIGHLLIGGWGLRAAQAAFFEDEAVLRNYMPAFEHQMQFKGFRAAMLSTLREMNMDDFSDGYQGFAKRLIPTRVFWAVNDRATPFENSVTFKKLVPHATLTPLTGVGHASLYERPEVIAQGICVHVRIHSGVSDEKATDQTRVQRAVERLCMGGKKAAVARARKADGPGVGLVREPVQALGTSPGRG